MGVTNFNDLIMAFKDLTINSTFKVCYCCLQVLICFGVHVYNFSRLCPCTGTDGEMDSEEFYDVHTDDEDDTLKETANGHVGILDLDDVSIHVLISTVHFLNWSLLDRKNKTYIGMSLFCISIRNLWEKTYNRVL